MTEKAMKGEMAMDDERQLNERCETTANNILLGRKIVAIHWMGKEEADEVYGWYKRPIKLELDDGTLIVPQQDDEGNDGGVLLVETPNETVTHPSFPGELFRKSEVLPVLGVEE